MTRIAGSSKTTTCPICGRRFPCGVSGLKDVCWCYYFPSVDDSPLKEKGIKTCACPICLRQIALQQNYPEDLLPEITFTETDWTIDGLHPK